MLGILLLIINASVALLGVYIFDYRVDGAINNPVTILLSIVFSIVITILILWLYIELFYIFIAKKKSQDSMTKHYFMKQIMSVPLVLTNTRIKVVGLENLPVNPGFSIYSNHTSMMDAPALMYKLKKYPIAFLSKEVTERIVVIGKWTPTLGCVMLDRGNARKGSESIADVVQNIKNGLSMVIFPEGTRSKAIGEMNNFKPGSFRVALKSNAPLVPVTIQKPQNFKKVLWPFPKRVVLVIHKALPFDEFKELSTSELAKKVKTIIEDAL
jgi:1-acyl-sn-glycerol-3-phosphate acyltransferase